MQRKRSGEQLRGSVHRTCKRTPATSWGAPKSSVTHSFELDDASHDVYKSPSATKVAFSPPLDDSEAITETLCLEEKARDETKV